MSYLPNAYSMMEKSEGPCGCGVHIKSVLCCSVTPKGSVSDHICLSIVFVAKHPYLMQEEDKKFPNMPISSCRYMYDASSLTPTLVLSLVWYKKYVMRFCNVSVLINGIAIPPK